jgi:hypothetical protein
MNKLRKHIHWVIIGALTLLCLILILSLNSLLSSSVRQTRSQQSIETAFLATRTAYDTRIESLLNELDKAAAARDIYASQLQEAESSLKCPRHELFKPNYILDKDMGTGLTDFLNQTEVGEVKAVKNERIWPGLGFISRTTLFTITIERGEEQFQHKFIVYHIDRFFNKNRVFSIAKQCWLD